MRVYIKIKHASKRGLSLHQQPFDLPDFAQPPSLGGLIAVIVADQVGAYDKKVWEQPVMAFLEPAQIAAAAASGKVHFGTKYRNEAAAHDLQTAIQIALKAHVDGLYAVAIDGQLVNTLDDPAPLKEGSVLTFLKLTLLSG